MNLPWRSLRAKIIAWSVIPTTIVIIAVVLVSFDAYRRVAEDLVVGRNREVTRLAAGQLATDLAEYSNLLSSIVRNADLYNGSPQAQREILVKSRDKLAVFDAGTVILNDQGLVTVTEPIRSAPLWEDWSDRSYYRQMLRSPGAVFSNIVADGPNETDVVVVAVPILGSQSEFKGTILGMFRVGTNSVSALYGGIVKLRIGGSGNTYLIDGNGRVVYHTDTQQIGTSLKSQTLARLLLSGRDGDVRPPQYDPSDSVASYAQVRGTPWVLVVDEQWATLMDSSAGHKEFLVILLIMAVLLPALVATAGVSKITGPISQLIDAAKIVAGGGFGHTISVSTRDELEELANQFNQMSSQLQESYGSLERKVEKRTQELAGLAAENARLYAAEQRRADQFLLIGEVGHRITSILDVDVLLGEIVRLVRENLGYNIAQIGLIEDDKLVVRAGCGAGWPQEEFPPPSLQVGTQGIMGWVAAHGEPLLAPDVEKEPRYYLSPYIPNTRAELAVPMRTHEATIGVLDVQSETANALDESDVSVLQTLAHQAAIAIENARLYQQARRLAIMEERARLARDLHDSVTQAVYGVTLYAEAATRLLAAGDIETASDHLRELRATSQQALREMRSLIFELRPPVLEKEGLIAALQARLEAVEERAGIRTDLVVEGETTLPMDIQEGLYRVCQEALNNSLRHALAQHVRVRLCIDDRKVQLEVVDDGVGFDLESALIHRGLGLSGMEERAVRLGGRFSVWSKPGEGTIVKVEVGR